MGVFSENAIIGASNASGYDIDYSLKCNGGSDAHWANATAEYLARTVSSGAGAVSYTHLTLPTNREV